MQDLPYYHLPMVSAGVAAPVPTGNADPTAEPDAVTSVVWRMMTMPLDDILGLEGAEAVHCPALFESLIGDEGASSRRYM